MKQCKHVSYNTIVLLIHVVCSCSMTFSCYSAGLTVEEDDLRYLLLPRCHPREEEVWTTRLEHQGQSLSLSLFFWDTENSLHMVQVVLFLTSIKFYFF